MSLAGGWLLAPAVLAIVCIALGMLAERLVRRRVPGTVVPALGLAALIAVAGVATAFDATAEATVPLVAGLSVVSLVSQPPWRDPRLRAAWPWPLVTAAAAFAIYALPSVWSGQGSIAGYVKLDDSATWLAITDHVFRHGSELAGLAPSSVSVTLESWLAGGYPTGAFMPLGVAASLSGQDPANAYQPLIAVAAAILALGLFGCAREVVRSDGRAAACAVIGVQASVALGYAQWGGIKEVVTAALLAPLALLAVRGHLLALAIVAGALLDVLGLNGLAWAGPALLAGAVAVRRPAPVAAAAAACLLAAVPALLAVDFLEQTTRGAISAEGDLGNLARPVEALQGAGVWPAGDFRADPSPRWLAVLLAVAVLAAAYAALLAAWRERRWLLPVLAGIVLTGGGAAIAVGAPWIDAKAYAIVSPVVLTLAAVALARSRIALAVLGAVLAWSTLLVARDVHVAPHDRLSELHAVAPLVAGEGPALVLDFDVYASRHFLRAADPEGASDLRPRPVTLRDGSTPPALATVEVDDVATPDLWVYRTLVRRRTPVGSRPPAAFARVHAGSGYEVWQRDPAARAPLARLPLGDPLAPVAVPECGAVRALARTPGTRVLAAAPRVAPVVIDLGEAGIPPPWRTADGVRPVVDGTAAVPAGDLRGGQWRVWIGGSALGRLEVRAQGRSLGVRRHDLAHDGQWLRFGTAAPGDLMLDYARGRRAGRGKPDEQAPLGPVALTPAADDAPGPVVQVRPRDYRRFCDGRTYDWIEALPAPPENLRR